MNKKLVALVLSLGLAGTLAACGGETTTTPEATPAGGSTPAAPAGGATTSPAAPAGGAKSTDTKSPAAGEKGEKSPAATPATKTP
ncbi:hypothetical protein NG798_07405 [Ancylothrix sp. C2]|uniref:hypothetical protein n=1 Tax=Ancylothrix sp. D3o TaxID=2953691 RepID=UPI0021BA7DF0|nr:hypothetical protein [Ancylothrix sp. D3o]MCT7949609.1 hypothetical protein [Ancylothrix sp. D3o]